MIILGISCFYHDSAACLIEDGKLIAAAEEERFTRKKHDSSFPINAIEFVMKKAGVTIEQVNHIGFYEKPLLKFDRLLHQHLQMFPSSFWSFYKGVPRFINEKLRITKIIKKKLKYKRDVHFIEHHLAHAAGCFLISPFEKAAILTVDGVGEWTTSSYGLGEGNKINLMKEIKFPHSLGLLYSTITGYLGFSVNNSEYKVMGLSAYGVPRYYEELKKIVDIKEDGSYQLDMSYFDYHHKMHMPSKKLERLLGHPTRKSESELTQFHKDVSASLQKITEEILFKILNHLHKVTGCDNLVMSGGVALNSVGNGKIKENTPFKNIFIPPSPSDAGSSIGVAYYIYNSILGKERTFVFEVPYLGPSFNDSEIKKFLDDARINYTELNEKEISKTAAKLINDSNVIGWFQEGMEWGPRALGARSILSNPTNKEMQAILNLKVKHREKFRPFAPVVSEEDASTYFDSEGKVPYMLFVRPIKKKYHKIIPAVTHVDGTGRLQTINKKQNERYYDVIKEFEKLSGYPILINTSFNIRGEPIVCAPYDAYRCMMGTGIDYLIMGKFLIAREDNPQHMWDSEVLAKD